ncbi:hypothetical protein [Geomonas ferrireducens]|uniref:hypothetical protein n=1 Tax=Geomonas ferrireducens TaxID=2570227 RepID=UPI0010A822D6|nr:hypothetical protein [Geomonas ferrireducens]
MNPGKAMLTLCQRFLDQHQGPERADLLNQMAEMINDQPGMDTPYPTTARELKRRVDGLLETASKDEAAKEMLLRMDKFDLDGETLEGLAASLSGQVITCKGMTSNLQVF